MSSEIRSGPGSIRAAVLEFVARQSWLTDWGLLLALALGLFAATPFLTHAELPHHTDAELHVYRAAELGRAIREGVLYPRWAPNLYLGYGYPIFNYYAPFTYYLSNALALILPGVGTVGGVKAVFVLGFIVASVGTYLLGRTLFDAKSALLAAASFTFSPYVLFIDPHARGDLAEHFAICLTPLAFHFFHKATHSPSRATLLGSILSLGAVVFSHNLLGIVTGGLMLAYWIWQLVLGSKRQRAVCGPVVFCLGAALIAIFWVPALLESDAVKLQVVGPGHFDFREHFLSLGELLAPSRLLDWGAAGPRFRHNLGVAQWILALPVVLVIAKGDGTPEGAGVRRGALFFLVVSVCLIALTLPVSELLWEAVPPMAYLQFPWRLLGPANLMLALCAAAGTTVLWGSQWRSRVTGAGIALVIATALPLMYPAPWPPEFGGVTPGDTIRWEQRSQALGTTSTGDFLPVTVEVIPPPMPTLVESYTSGGPVDKVNRATLPTGTTVTVAEHKPNYDHFRVNTREEFVLRLYTFYFPGWRAYVDGERVDIDIADPEGFITVKVPAGEHDVLVRFEDTPPRKAGSIVSLAAVAVLAGILVSWPRQEASAFEPAGLKEDRTGWVWIGGTLMLIILLKFALFDPKGWFHRSSPPGRALPAQHKLHANFADQIELLGYDLPQRLVRPGDTVSLVLYWHAITDVQNNYQSFVHLAEPLDVAWAQEDHLNPGGLPTSRWPRDKYVWDEYEIRVPADMPSGDYRLNAGLYLRSDGTRLLRVDGIEGGGEADSVVVDSVRVSERTR